MRSVTLEPNFGKRNTRQLVSGGMAGNLILHEKGWLGHKEVTLHSGEGPIWATEWRGTLIAWANDAVSSVHVSVLKSYSPLTVRARREYVFMTPLLVKGSRSFHVPRIRQERTCSSAQCTGKTTVPC